MAKAEREATRSVFKKKIEAQFSSPLIEFRSSVPQDPHWGEKNSEGKNFDIVTMVYNASKLACDRLNVLLKQQAA